MYVIDEIAYAIDNNREIKVVWSSQLMICLLSFQQMRSGF